MPTPRCRTARASIRMNEGVLLLLVLLHVPMAREGHCRPAHAEGSHSDLRGGSTEEPKSHIASTQSAHHSGSSTSHGERAREKKEGVGGRKSKEAGERRGKEAAAGKGARPLKVALPLQGSFRSFAWSKGPEHGR